MTMHQDITKKEETRRFTFALSNMYSAHIIVASVIDKDRDRAERKIHILRHSFRDYMYMNQVKLVNNKRIDDI